MNCTPLINSSIHTSGTKYSPTNETTTEVTTASQQDPHPTHHILTTAPHPPQHSSPHSPHPYNFPHPHHISTPSPPPHTHPSPHHPTHHILATSHILITAPHPPQPSPYPHTHPSPHTPLTTSGCTESGMTTASTSVVWVPTEGERSKLLSIPPHSPSSEVMSTVLWDSLPCTLLPPEPFLPVSMGRRLEPVGSTLSSTLCILSVGTGMCPLNMSLRCCTEKDDMRLKLSL